MSLLIMMDEELDIMYDQISRRLAEMSVYEKGMDSSFFNLRVVSFTSILKLF